MNRKNKVLSLWGIKYFPTVAAITCSIKIWLLCSSHIPKDTYVYLVNWINWFLGVLTLGIVWNLGRCFGYCWKHRSLCRLALWGYLWYAWFLIVGVIKAEVSVAAMIYVGIVLILTIIYREWK